jgi:hypothetical protein
MGGISPIVLSLTALDRERARLKALKEAAGTAGRDPRQANGMRVRLRVLEANAELERIESASKTEGKA